MKKRSTTLLIFICLLLITVPAIVFSSTYDYIPRQEEWDEFLETQGDDPNSNFAEMYDDSELETSDSVFSTNFTRSEPHISATTRYGTLSFEVTHDFTIEAEAGGSIVSGENWAYPGSTILNIAAEPDSGFEFTGWSSTGGGEFGNANNSSTTFVMPYAPTIVTAHFALIDPSSSTELDDPTNPDTEPSYPTTPTEEPPTDLPVPINTPVSGLSASETQIALPHTTTASELSITTDGEWIASSSEPWLSVSPPYGSGNGSITITTSHNLNTIFDRTGTITLTSEDQSITVSVTQDRFDIDMGTTVSRGPFTWHFLTIPANTSWEASSDSPWITLSATSGTGDERISMIIAENTTQSYRMGMVTFTSGGQDRHFTVTQTDTEPPSRNSGTGGHPMP